MAASAANKATFSGVGVTFLGWTTSSNFGMWMGIIIGVSGLLVNLYYKRKSDKRSAEAHQVYMKETARQSAALRPPSETEDEKEL
jgi:Bacteriophage holin family, superfamily II-like